MGRGIVENSTGKRNKNHVHFVLPNSTPCILKRDKGKTMYLYEVELLLLLLWSLLIHCYSQIILQIL